MKALFCITTFLGLPLVPPLCNITAGVSFPYFVFISILLNLDILINLDQEIKNLFLGYFLYLRKNNQFS